MTVGSFRRVSGRFVPSSPTSNTLWRIMDLGKLETLLVKRGLWLSRLDQFGADKFGIDLEGALPCANKMGLLSMFPAPDAAWLTKEYEHGVLRSYASCWHARDDQPAEKIWWAFDKTGQGVAVQVNFTELLDQLEAVAPKVNSSRALEDGPIHVGAVRYVDHAVDSVPEYNVLEAQFVVRRKWSYQTELRVLVHTHGTAAYDRLYKKTGPFGRIVKHIPPSDSISGKTECVGGHLDGKALVLPVDPRRLVRGILVNKKMTLVSRGKLAMLAARTGMLCRVRWC